MGKVKDMTGERFGRLTVLHRDFDAPTGHGAFWACKCDCGNITSVRGDALRSSKTTSCGCYQREQIDASSYKRILDITGKRFGKLVVLQLDENTSIGAGHQTQWLCKCDCGTYTTVTSYELRSGNTKSCGCQRGKKAKDLQGQRFGTLTVLERDYQYGTTKWWCRCDCGAIKSVRASNLVAGTTKTCGRISCKENIRSNGELLLDRLLTQSSIDFDTEHKFADLIGIGGGLLRFDFYLPNYNIAIEYDGEQHYMSSDFFGGDKVYETIRIHDQLKNEYCKEHNIQLIRIPYWKTDEEIKQIIENIQESRNDHSLEGNDKTYADNSPTLAS